MYINNKLLTLMIHACYERNDHCTKHLHHTLTLYRTRSISIGSTGEQLASLFGIHVHVYMCIEIRIRLKSIFYYIISQ